MPDLEPLVREERLKDYLAERLGAAELHEEGLVRVAGLVTLDRQVGGAQPLREVVLEALLPNEGLEFRHV
ncbi:MAG TPA: hypothetical protein VM573_06835, partial [Actinomycetota bacterium]|nr:hypothetical protein [Actinomycetota bacterium]